MKKEIHKRVELRAYEIWHREGCPDGKATEHWAQAVAEIAVEDAEAAATEEKKVGPRKKAEKSEPKARAKKTASASAAKRQTQKPGKKTAAKPKAVTATRAKKTAK